MTAGYSPAERERHYMGSIHSSRCPVCFNGLQISHGSGPRYMERLGEKWWNQEESMQTYLASPEDGPAGPQAEASVGSMEDVHLAMLKALQQGYFSSLEDAAVGMVEYLQSQGWVLIDRTRLTSTLWGMHASDVSSLTDRLFRAWGIDR